MEIKIVEAIMLREVMRRQVGENDFLFGRREDFFEGNMYFFSRRSAHLYQESRPR